MTDYHKILQGILDIGEEMIVSGAEVNRVEDSIKRMCVSYGATEERVNVFIITSNIQVTIETPDGSIITQIRRILRRDVNFDRLDYLNDLCRNVCNERPELEEMHRMFDEVMNRPKQHWLLDYLGAILAAGGFAVFFGGSYQDFFAAGAVAVIMQGFGRFLAAREKNQIVYSFVVSIIAGIVTLLLSRIGFGLNADKIMIGAIMLLIPGIAMTNSVRDMLMGDIATGILRLIDAVMIAGAIACGFALSIIMLGGVL